MDRQIVDYEIIDHGVHNSQYFQGCGTYGTDFDQVYTGIGCSAHEALGDAVDSSACGCWDCGIVSNTLSRKITVPEGVEDTCHFVSLRLR